MERISPRDIVYQIEEMRVAQQAAERLVGDPHPLVACLGVASPGEGARSGLTSRPPGVVDAASLTVFLDWYRRDLLVPVELPAIRQAWAHYARYELRELIELDLRLALDPRIRPFAAASRAVGRSQLRRLLPMRDQRLVRRYYEAVELGRANGWHILVFGLVLGLFSLPLRQGLQHYSRQALAGFIDQAAGPLRLRLAQCEALLADAIADLPSKLDRVDGEEGVPKLMICR